MASGQVIGIRRTGPSRRGRASVRVFASGPAMASQGREESLQETKRDRPVSPGGRTLRIRTDHSPVRLAGTWQEHEWDRMNELAAKQKLEQELAEVNKVLDSFKYKTQVIYGLDLKFPVSPDPEYFKAKKRRDEIGDALRKLDRDQAAATLQNEHNRLKTLVGKTDAVKVNGIPATIIAFFGSRADVKYNGKKRSVPIADIKLPSAGLWTKSTKGSDGNILPKSVADESDDSEATE